MGFWKKILGKKETESKEETAVQATPITVDQAITEEKNFLSECQTESNANIVCDLLLQSTEFFVGGNRMMNDE